MIDSSPSWIRRHRCRAWPAAGALIFFWFTGSLVHAALADTTDPIDARALWLGAVATGVIALAFLKVALRQ